MTFVLTDVIYLQYFLRRFTIHHIVPNTKLPAHIQVFFKNKEVAKVKMVMNKWELKGKLKGGAMITSNWMEVVKKIDMRVGDIYVFWFRGSRDGLKLFVDHL